MNRKNLVKPLKSNKGITIIETVVAIGVIGIILTALVAMVVTAVYTSDLSKNRTIATNYASDGEQVARSIRDGNSWSTFAATYLALCSPAPGCKVTATGGLAAAGLSIAPFTRTVRLTDASPAGDPNSRVQVDVIVTWNNRGKTEKIELISYLTNWFR